MNNKPIELETKQSAPNQKITQTLGAKPDEQIPAKLVIGLSYGFIWAVVLLFVIILAKRLRKLQKNLREMENLLQSKNIASSHTTSETSSLPK